MILFSANKFAFYFLKNIEDVMSNFSKYVLSPAKVKTAAALGLSLPLFPMVRDKMSLILYAKS